MTRCEMAWIEHGSLTESKEATISQTVHKVRRMEELSRLHYVPSQPRANDRPFMVYCRGIAKPTHRTVAVIHDRIPHGGTQGARPSSSQIVTYFITQHDAIHTAETTELLSNHDHSCLSVNPTIRARSDFA